MMGSLLSKLQSKLDQRQQTDTLRTLHQVNNLIDFCSNDYLGLARNVQLQKQVEETLHTLPQPTGGATGSRLIAGTNQYVTDLEKFLASFFEAEACLIFNSGYQANSALLSTVAQKGDIVLCDELIHASLREGARLSFADNFYFKHNDLDDLEKKLQRISCTGEKFVVIETVYSMEGDYGQVEAISELCQKYGAHLIVDEAHSTGIYGQQGRGYLYQTQVHQKVFARVYTFGKAIGVHGACIAGPKILIDYLINFARAFIYTTALPLHSLVSIRKAFEYVIFNKNLIKELHQKTFFFREQLNTLPNTIGQLKESTSPIQILKIGGSKKTKDFAQNLRSAGYDIRAILSPTVKEGEEMLRICLHSFNEEAQILALARFIQASSIKNKINNI